MTSATGTWTRRAESLRHGMFVHRNGFTLVELLLSLAIIATIVGIALPSIASRLSHMDVDTAELQVYQRLTQTRTRAMDEGRSWTFVFSSDHQTYCAFPTGQPDQLRQWKLAESVRFELPERSRQPAGDGSNRIHFYSDGTCTNFALMIKGNSVKGNSGNRSVIHVSRLRGVSVE